MGVDPTGFEPIPIAPKAIMLPSYTMGRSPRLFARFETEFIFTFRLDRPRKSASVLTEKADGHRYIFPCRERESNRASTGHEPVVLTVRRSRRIAIERCSRTASCPKKFAVNFSPRAAGIKPTTERLELSVLSLNYAPNPTSKVGTESALFFLRAIRESNSGF